MAKKTSSAVVLSMFAVGIVTSLATVTSLGTTPARAQDDRVAADDVRDLNPTFDLRPGGLFRTQQDMYGLGEGRSAVRASDRPGIGDLPVPVTAEPITL